MLWALLASVAMAGPVERPEPVPGQCPRHIPIRKGEALPAVLAGPAVAKCSAVAVPLSDMAYFLDLEIRLIETDKLHALDVSILKNERDHYREALKKAQDLKWYEKPAAHRWAGRLDIIITAAVISGTVGAAYQISR